MSLNYFWQGLLELVYPARQTCPLCGSQKSKGEICTACLQWVRRQSAGPVCPICGRFLSTLSYEVSNYGRRQCSICLSYKPSFDMARAVAPYKGQLRDAVLHLKSRGTRRMAAALGELMAGAARREPAFAAVEVIVPVPLAIKRLSRRGFNQAQLLAEELGRILELPVSTESVIKVKETRPQAGLSKSEREINLADAFSVVAPDKIHGRKVLLVDDVFTTGATVENISIKLRQVQTAGIYVLTAAGGLS